MGNRKETLDELFRFDDESKWEEYEKIKYYDYANKDGRDDKQMEKALNSELGKIKEVEFDKFFNILIEPYYEWIRMQPVNKNFITENKEILKKSFMELVAFEYERTLCEKPCCEYYGKYFSILEQVKGIGEVSASGLLAIIHPELFGILNSDVQEILKEKYPGEFDGREKCVLMEEKLLEISKELNKAFGGDYWTPRRVDKVLWSVAKESEKKSKL